MQKFLVLTTLLLVMSTTTIGCSRNHYRLRADNDGYSRVFEKSGATPWMPPGDYNVYPAPHSRLYDPSCVNDPCLPIPSPQLYEYELPGLPPRDNERFRVSQSSIGNEYVKADLKQPAEAAPPTPDGEYNELAPPPTPSPVDPAPQVGPSVSSKATPFMPVSFGANRKSNDLDAFYIAYRTNSNAIQAEMPLDPADEISKRREDTLLTVPDIPAVDVESDGLTEEEAIDPLGDRFDDSPRTRLVPIPKSYWEQISKDCLARMLEFPSVQKEYEATFGSVAEPDLQDDSPKLSLEDIIDLTLLNSRELQTQKEQLFRTALVLTLERFDYQLKPSVNGNGTDVNYDHNRSDRLTTDGLRIPTSLQLEKMLYTGGDFLGRFANSVLLNFNGPQGFTADVSSELLFNFTQSLLQRDVQLESLTQAERNVVYAARDFARFRKELFVQQASDYYSLIRQFRQIEINCQNYFTLAREFNQRSVEITYGFAARTQLDQVEQQVINGRQSILSTCTSLENALDSLKIRMGIPTEQPLNLDLSELNLLTLNDELAVNAELIERTRQRVQFEMASTTPSPFVVVGALTQLTEQMLDSIQLREQLGENPPDTTELEDALMQLRVEAADIDGAEVKEDLQQVLNEEAQFPTRVFLRRRDVIGELLKKVAWQIRLLHRQDEERDVSDSRVAKLHELSAKMEKLEAVFLELSEDPIEESTEESNAPAVVEESPASENLVESVAALQHELQAMADELDQKIGRTTPRGKAGFEDRAMELADSLMRESERFRDAGGGGLVPIQIEMDDAMMTALVQRFDLMNERGFLADDWRQIKYSADDLRSVLNLQASQSVRTRSGRNEPFDFTFDDSSTSVGLSLDLPFNRRAQRNRYRASLFDYQSALRRVMQLEDNIKLSVRRDLRALTLDRQQYKNDVSGAALASGRVTGTELEVRLGVATSRDFLESQTAYVQAVSNVASRHINYIVGRLQLFLDLESLTVGENGFWDELYDENYQPESFYKLPGYEPAYGRLHPKLKYSPRIRRMRCVPVGQAMVHQRQDVSNAKGSKKP